MAIVRARIRFVSLCCFAALPAAACAQDASAGFGEQTTRTEQTSSSSTTSTTQSMGGPPQDGTSTDQNGDAAFGNLGSINQQTSTTGTSHAQTHTERKEGSVDIDLGDNDDDWRHEHDRDGRVDDRGGWDPGLVGNWTLGQESGNTCTIQLKDSEWFGGHGAYVPAGCPDGFFAANRWVMSGRQLLITDTNNTVIGRFRPAGGGRWSGRRESDGARLFLNPGGR